MWHCQVWTSATFLKAGWFHSVPVPTYSSSVSTIHRINIYFIDIKVYICISTVYMQWIPMLPVLGMTGDTLRCSLTPRSYCRLILFGPKSISICYWSLHNVGWEYSDDSDGTTMISDYSNMLEIHLSDSRRFPSNVKYVLVLPIDINSHPMPYFQEEAVLLKCLESPEMNWSVWHKTLTKERLYLRAPGPIIVTNPLPPGLLRCIGSYFFPTSAPFPQALHVRS